MLVIQPICEQVYESKVMVLETLLSVGASIIIEQEPFIGSRKIGYSGFYFYWQ